MRGFMLGVCLTVAVFGGGLGLTTDREPTNATATTTGLWADACVVMVEDASLYFPAWDYGSLKFVGAYVGNHDGAFLTDYAARQAVASFECQQVY